MTDLLKNFAYCALTSAVTTNSQTTWAVDETSRLPTNTELAAADFYMTTESTYASGAFEIVKVTAKSTTSGAGNLTVVRGQEATTALSTIASTTILKHSLTAGIMGRLPGISVPPNSISKPQGNLQRRYTFDTDVQSWTQTGGSASSIAGHLQTVVSAGTNGVSLEPSTAGTIQNGEIVFDLLDGTFTSDYPYFGPIFRAADANNFYMITVRPVASGGDNFIEFYKRVSGTFTLIKSIGPATVGAPSFMQASFPLRVMIRFVGSSISLYLNETLIATFFDTSITSAGYVGIYSSGATYQFDNVTVYALSSGWTPANYDTPVAGMVVSPQSIVRPQGTLQRRYTFDTTTESWTASGGTLSQTSGKAQFSHTTGNTYGRAYEPSSAAAVSDGELVIDITPVTFDPQGLLNLKILFRYVDDNNHYELTIQRGAYASAGTPQIILSKIVGGSSTTVAISPTTGGANVNDRPFVTTSSDVSTVRLMVRFFGSRIWVFVNEAFILSATDTSLTSGRVGVGDYMDGTGTSSVFQFDNVTVYALANTWTPANYDTPSISGLQAWQTPTFQNSWVNFGSGFSTAGYYLGPEGQVHLRGLVKTGTVGSPIFTLPVGYRPEFPMLFAVPCTAAGTPTYAELRVGSDGTVTPQTGAQNGYLSIDGLSFRQYA